jgi:hypothetical protein
MNVTVEIEELVLHGFPAEWRYAVAEALERELAARIAERGLALGPAQHDFDALPPLKLQLSPDATPDQLGRRAAQVLHEALEDLG